MAILSETIRRHEAATFLFTGEPNLDNVLALIHRESGFSSCSQVNGVPMNSFTEISGPRGSGKSAIWLSLSMEALRRGMHVLYISCNFEPFPLSRAQTLPGWNSERYQDRIHQLNISSMEEFLLLGQKYDISKYGLVVMSLYNNLIRHSLGKETRIRASEALLQTASRLSQNTCVVATSSCVKYLNEEHETLLAPATVHARVKPLNTARISIYKDFQGNSIISTGVKFRIDSLGVQPANGPISAPAVPLHCLSSARRLTPERRSGNYMITPQTQKKRRNSQSTPIKSQKLGSDLGGSNPIPEYPRLDSIPHSSETQHHHRHHLQMLNTQTHTSSCNENMIGKSTEEQLDRCSAGFQAKKSATSHQDFQNGGGSSGTLTHVYASGPQARPASTSSFSIEEALDSEIIPNSQVEVNDTNYEISKN